MPLIPMKLVVLVPGVLMVVVPGVLIGPVVGVVVGVVPRPPLKLHPPKVMNRTLLIMVLTRTVRIYSGLPLIMGRIRKLLRGVGLRIPNTTARTEVTEELSTTTGTMG